jgi:hypothetical protein
LSQSQNFHETFRREEAARGSDRNFGFVVGAALSVIACLPLLRGSAPRWYLLPIAAALVLAALVAPRLLFPLNWLWHRLGLMLQKVVNPVVMLVIFALGVVPTGLVLRILRKDPMRRKFDTDADSYWIKRDPPGPLPDTMKNQF